MCLQPVYMQAYMDVIKVQSKSRGGTREPVSDGMVHTDNHKKGRTLTDTDMETKSLKLTEYVNQA